MIRMYSNGKERATDEADEIRMFDAKNWPLQDYKTLPFTQGRGLGGLLNPSYNPCTDVASASWLKRREVKSILESKVDYVEIDLQGMSVEDYMAEHPELSEMQVLDPTVPRATQAEATPTSAASEGEHGASTPGRGAIVLESKPAQTASARKAHLWRHRHHRSA